MNTELTYLLEELDNWDENKPIQVKDLKRMIEKAFKQETIEDELWGNVFAKIKQYGLNYEVLTVLKQNFNISKR